MAHCTNCGANSPSGRFCANCGNPAQSAAPASSPSAAELPENAASLLCYFLWALTGVIFLVIEPHNRSKLVRFHAWQSILTSLVIFAGWFVVLLAATILRLLPWIGAPLALAVLNIFGLAVLVLWLLLMFKAYQGGSLDLPYISQFAQKQA